MKPCTKRTSEIAKLPVIHDLKYVETFLQTCLWQVRGELRCTMAFIRQNAPFVCCSEQQIYDHFKNFLTSTPILKQNDEKKLYFLRTDASSCALNAVGHRAEEHPIKYASLLLPSSENNYSTTEQVMVAIWTLNKCRGYVDGFEVKVATDHQRLRCLKSLKSSSGRLARLALIFQSF